MSLFHDLEMISIAGEPVSFAQFEDTVCLIVNVATDCGLTPQYAGLRALHEANDGFSVLAFPCNQFGQQEPGTDAEIHEFATSRYGVDFPMFAKIEVNGDGAAELYRWLKAEQPGEGESSDVTWNFEKFLVNGKGEVVARWSPKTTPEDVGEQLSQFL
jgi:glutathione peroxidase